MSQELNWYSILETLSYQKIVRKRREKSKTLWSFVQKVKKHIAYIHIKDARLENGAESFLYPGDGDACIPQILQMLYDSNYQGGISIEPHMASVFHDPNSVNASAEESYAIYLEYDRRLMVLLEKVGYKPKLYGES